jgi:hypothetical protein
MHDSKICFKCGIIKPLSDFYKHKGMADGRLNKCKECNKKDTKENRLNNIDYYLEYDRSRANLPGRIKSREDYQKTPEGRAAANKARRKYTESNLIKRAASLLINNYVRNGKITKPTACSECNVSNVRIHGHHNDYAKPLEVRWLCSKCHCKWHKKNGPGLNG